MIDSIEFLENVRTLKASKKQLLSIESFKIRWFITNYFVLKMHYVDPTYIYQSFAQGCCVTPHGQLHPSFT